jgi:tetrahydromethanopterin S-methyltransferase subunit F
MDRLDGVKATREYMQDLKMSLSSLWLSRDWDLKAGVSRMQVFGSGMVIILIIIIVLLMM